MKVIHGVELKQGSQEEVLPDFSPDFPLISSYIELDRYIGRQSPWHWHKEIELFYVEQGELEYNTPHGKLVFPAGSGGLINSNVLHLTTAMDGFKAVTAFLHLFDPLLISGQRGSAIDRSYVLPFVTNPNLEMVALYPENPEHAEILGLFLQSFRLPENSFAYELRLRAILSEVWSRILEITEDSRHKGGGSGRSNENVKKMMVYVHEHFADKLSVADIAASAFLSERECFRIFKDCLHTSPMEYLTGYRLQKACQLLAESSEPITAISHACGLGSSSYFGKVFREHLGCSPMRYRTEWRNRDRKWQK